MEWQHPGWRPICDRYRCVTLNLVGKFHFIVSDLIYANVECIKPLEKYPLFRIHIIIHISCCCRIIFLLWETGSNEETAYVLFIYTVQCNLRPQHFIVSQRHHSSSLCKTRESVLYPLYCTDSRLNETLISHNNVCFVSPHRWRMVMTSWWTSCIGPLKTPLLLVFPFHCLSID
jgi:hypothetical protein